MSNQSPKRLRAPIDIGEEVLDPRADFAKRLGISERTIVRMNLPTTYIGNAAYVARDASLRIVAAGVRQANTPRSR